MTQYRICIALVAICAGIMDGAWAQVPAYYYQGRHKVTVDVQTDALAVQSTTAASLGKAKISAAIPGAKVEAAPGLSNKLQVITAAKTLGELNQQAAKLRQLAPDTRVQAILRIQESTPDQPAKSLTNQLSFKVLPEMAVNVIAAKYALLDVTPVEFAADTYIAKVSDKDLLAALNVSNQMQESGDAEWASPLVEAEKSRRAVPNDPLFINQWHLRNLGSNTVAGIAGNDLNVVTAWDSVKGTGVNIVIADDGVETTHSDLMANIRSALDYDFNSMDADPGPLPSHSHGTGCAGVAAGKGNNGIGISGVAPEAGIIGLRILGGPITDAVEGTALAWRKNDTDPSTYVGPHSNSWGPWDDGRTLEGPGPLTEAAMQAAVTEGRNGKGTVFLWAAGNGRLSYDNVNKDGYANSPYVIAVGATNSSGTVSYYSEPGAPMLVNAPSSDVVDGIYTTDITGPAGADPGNYRPNFGGTSSATPAVAGVVALMLEANPELTYRDVMHILVQTSTKNDPSHSGWITNGAGLPFNHNYGFGRVDATAAVAAAAGWQNVPVAAPVITANVSFPAPEVIPDANPAGVLKDIPVTAPANFVVEHVELETNIKHTWRGDLVILLQSPSGMISELILTAESYDNGDDYNHWRFRSVAHWGESAAGMWRVLIADHYPNDIGNVDQLTLRIRGHIAPQASAEMWHLY